MARGKTGLSLYRESALRAPLLPSTPSERAILILWGPVLLRQVLVIGSVTPRPEACTCSICQLFCGVAFLKLFLIFYIFFFNQMGMVKIRSLPFPCCRRDLELGSMAACRVGLVDEPVRRCARLVGLWPWGFSASAHPLIQLVPSNSPLPGVSFKCVP